MLNINISALVVWHFKADVFKLFSLHEPLPFSFNLVFFFLLKTVFDNVFKLIVESDILH